MFFILSKILQFVINPMVWIVFIFVLTLFTKSIRKKRKRLIGGICVLLFFTNGLLSELAFKSYEGEPKPIENLEVYDVGVILTGVVQTRMKPRDRVYFSKGADRVTHALHLYKIGKINRVLISGGSGEVIGEKYPEADLIKGFLIMSGVPDQDILVDNKSRNTRENALFSAEILEKEEGVNKVLLITSAFHMTRAKGCFEKVGLQVDTFKTDFRCPPLEITFSSILIPSSEAIGKWSVLIHELVGLATYRLLGYA